MNEWQTKAIAALEAQQAKVKNHSPQGDYHYDLGSETQ